MQNQTSSQWFMQWIMPFIIGAFGVVATLIVNHFYSKRKSKRERRESLFRTLMTTRGFRISLPHVEALCAVQVEFYGGHEQDEKVRAAWKVYRDHLDMPVPDDRPAPDAAGQAKNANFFRERDDKFVHLLHEIGIAIGKKYPKEELKNTSYGPGMWMEVEVDNLMLRKGLLRVLAGDAVLPVGIKYEYTAPVAPPAQEQPKAAAGESGT